MMPESPRKTNIPEQLGRPERRDPPMRERLLNEVLLHVAAQLRTALGGMHIAVGRLAPPDRRDRDAVLDRDAALPNHNYYSLLRLANNLSNAPMLLSDEPVTVHCPTESHSAKWRRRASARFSSTVCGAGSPVSRASSGQKRFCGWP